MCYAPEVIESCKVILLFLLSKQNQNKEPQIGKEAIKKLLAAVDVHIPQPVRELDKPFYLPIEQVFSISGVYSVCKLFTN